MKPHVFFDTNIMLDLILERPGYQDAARLLQRHEDGEITVCLSILSMANIAYVLRKTIPQNLLVPTLKQISSIVEVIKMDDDQLQKALLMEGPDFEDTLQASCAASCGCQVIITHNPRDFKIRNGLCENITLPSVMTPEEYEYGRS
ncbi:MAG: PIN domain-containing protein [Bacteroidales bacterium]|nr:PIN domain-containing protein [Bacteroidales bacterium]